MDNDRTVVRKRKQRVPLEGAALLEAIRTEKQYRPKGKKKKSWWVWALWITAGVLLIIRVVTGI